MVKVLYENLQSSAEVLLRLEILLMKLLVIFALVLTPLFAFGQSSLPASEHLYQKAFQYIKSDPKFLEMRGKSSSIAVFDSIVYQSQSLFLDELGKHWGFTNNKKTSQLRDSLFTLDQVSYHKPYYSFLTGSLTVNSGSKKGCLVILFSRLQNNMLLAEVSDNREGGLGLHHIISTFDQSVRYAFLFRPDGSIEQCYSQLLNYN